MLFLLLVPVAVVALGLVATRSSEGLRHRPVPSSTPEAAEPGPEAKPAPAGGPPPLSPARRRLGLVSLGVSLALAALVFFALKGEDWLGGPHTCVPPSPEQRLAWYTSPEGAFLGGFSYPIATNSSTAQRLFDLGLLLAWDFNRETALAAFRQAAAADPAAAMPLWGQAISLGPGANKDLTPTRQGYPSFTPEDFPEVHDLAQAAHDRAQAAAARLPASPLAAKEAQIARALASVRYAEGTYARPARDGAERGYAEALTGLGRAGPGDAALLAMAAEACLNTRPWQYYQADGALTEDAARAEGLIDEALALDPRQPLALHLKVHVAEAAPPGRGPPGAGLRAGRAEAAADQLARGRGPWDPAMGHLLHMPAHLYVRVGRWHDAVVSSIAALEGDLRDVRACQAPYEPEHNADMLIFAANMAGEFKVAERYAAAMRRFPRTMHTAYPEPYGAEWVHLPVTHTIQGKWSELLATSGQTPPPDARGLCPGGYDFAAATRIFGRVLALAAYADTAVEADDLPDMISSYRHAAGLELAALKETAARIPPEQGTVPGEFPGIYACDYARLAAIQVHMAEARVALLTGDFREAEAQLRAGVAGEDAMGYMEPPRQELPVRHCLGHVLLRRGQAAAALEVFEEQLEILPENGYALLGLAEAHTALGQGPEAAAARKRHEAAWAHADGPLPSPCPAFSSPGEVQISFFSRGRRLRRRRA